MRISWVSRQSETKSKKAGLIHISSLLIYWVLYWSRTYSNKYESMCIASLYISWIFIWSRISLIQLGTCAYSSIFIYTFKPPIRIAIWGKQCVRRTSLSHYCCFAYIINFHRPFSKYNLKRYIYSICRYLRYRYVQDVLTVCAGT